MGRVTDWAFDPVGLDGAPPMFRVPEDPFRRRFCTAETAQAIRGSGLLGFDIRKVWTSTPQADDEHPVSFPDTFEPPPRGRGKATRDKRRAALEAMSRHKAGHRCARIPGCGA